MNNFSICQPDIPGQYNPFLMHQVRQNALLPEAFGNVTDREAKPTTASNKFNVKLQVEAWKLQVIAKINALSEYQEDWDLCGSAAVDILTVHCALHFIEFLCDSGVVHIFRTVPDVFACPDGSIAMIWRDKAYSLRVVAAKEGLVTYVDELSHANTPYPGMTNALRQVVNLFAKG